MIEEDINKIKVADGSSLDVAFSGFHFSLHFVLHLPASIFLLQLIAHPPEQKTCIFPLLPTKTTPRRVPKTMRNHFHQ